jgi:hypothetical protein
MNAHAEVRYLRHLLREAYPYLADTAPADLLDDVELALLRVTHDRLGQPVTFTRSRDREP